MGRFYIIQTPIGEVKTIDEGTYDKDYNGRSGVTLLAEGEKKGLIFKRTTSFKTVTSWNWSPDKLAIEVTEKGRPVIHRVESGVLGEVFKEVVVRENQRAVFLKDGKVESILQAGRHDFTKLPWKDAEFVWVDMGRWTVKWGANSMTSDKIQVGSFGRLDVSVHDPASFVINTVSNLPEFYEKDIEERVRTLPTGIMRSEIAKLTAHEVYMEREMFTTAVRVKAQEALEKMGLELVHFEVEGVKLPEQVEAAMGSRTATILGAEGEAERIRMIKEQGVDVLELEKIKAMRDLAQKSTGGPVDAALVGSLTEMRSSAGEIRKLEDMLAKVDEKLLSGEITEQKHTEMSERIKKRLAELRRQ